MTLGHVVNKYRAGLKQVVMLRFPLSPYRSNVMKYPFTTRLQEPQHSFLEPRLKPNTVYICTL